LLVGDEAPVDGVGDASLQRSEGFRFAFGGSDNQSMQDVTVGGPGLVAVGSDGFLSVDRGRLTNNDDFTEAAAVWTSVDGLTWSRVPADDAVFGGEGKQWMNAVTSAGPGLVAVGGDWSSVVHHAAVWISVDGITWSWIPYDEAVFGSEDNSSFLLSDGPLYTEYRQFMSSVTATDTGVMAVGADWSGPSHGAAVWVAVSEE
jgi:hypothetical protein